MVSVERLFHVQVLLDVIVHVPPPTYVADFHDTIYEIQKQTTFIRGLINSLGPARENIESFYSLGIVNYDQRSVDQGWN